MVLQITKPAVLRTVWLIAAPLGGLLLYVVLATTSLALEARAAAAVTFWIAVWWITEPIPIAVTSLLPILLLPLCGVSSVSAAAAPYSDKTIFLFLGAFLIASALEKWQLHRRLALTTITILGTRPAMLVGGFMITTAFLSMWISNTAVALMMLPVGTSVIQAVNREQSSEHIDKNFACALVLGIAYAASIGGLGTIIGTPPNTLLIAFLNREYGSAISFAGWLKFGIPLTLVLLPITWLLLTRLFFPLSANKFALAGEVVRRELRQMGPMRSAEKRVLVVFVGTALLWVLRPLLTQLFPYALFKAIDDTSIALFGAIWLFILPANRERGGSDVGRYQALLDWPTAAKLPWHILLLFGGGLSIASGLENSGLAEYMGGQFSSLTLHPFLLVLVITSFIVFFGELASNTATVAIFLPILASVARGTGMDPHLLLIPASLAASLSFMVPVGTPPNALAYSTGYFTMGRMIRVGFWLDLLAIVTVTLVAFFLV